MTKTLYLVNPPNPMNMQGFPGSLLALDLWIRKRIPQVQSRIIDEEESHTNGRVKKEDLQRSLEEKMAGTSKDGSKDTYVGITCTTATYQDALLTAKIVKEIRADSKIILGGHHINGQEHIILKNHPEIDATVTGEGEKALEGILRGDKDIQGVTWQKNAGLYVLSNPITKGIRLSPKELDMLDVRVFDQEFQEKSTQFKEVNLVTARGCPKSCAFCSVANERVTAQHEEQVIEQIGYLVGQMKRKGKMKPIAIQDNFFAQSKSRAIRVAELLIEYRKQTDTPFEWNMQTRVEQFETPELAMLLAQAGCTAAYFGIENFDIRMLRVLGKIKSIRPESLRRYIEKAKTAIYNCQMCGILPYIQFQVGIPGEDHRTKSINESALQEIGQQAGSYQKRPIVFPSLSVVYPGTAFHDRMMHHGAPADVYERFTKYERIDEKYRKALYGYFAHGNGGIPLGIIDLQKLRDGQIDMDMHRLQRAKDYVNRLRAIEGIIVHKFTNSTIQQE